MGGSYRAWQAGVKSLGYIFKARGSFSRGNVVGVGEVVTGMWERTKLETDQLRGRVSNAGKKWGWFGLEWWHWKCNDRKNHYIF